VCETLLCPGQHVGISFFSVHTHVPKWLQQLEMPAGRLHGTAGRALHVIDYKAPIYATGLIGLLWLQTAVLHSVAEQC
jgi:hypothetical protein